jgi:hypothetical protein
VFDARLLLRFLSLLLLPQINADSSGRGLGRH